MQKNRVVLIAILACLVGIYFFVRSRGPQERQYPIFDLDSLAIAQIEVFDQANTLKLEKQKGKWMLVEPVKWEADTLRIQSLFQDVLSAEYPKTPMGKGKEAIERFKLKDNEALHIKISNARGSKSNHIMFSNMGNPFDYFRYAGKDEIYQIKAKVMTIYTTELPMWRSPDVVSITEDQISRMEISNINNSYTLSLKEYDWYYKDQQEDFMIPRTNRAIAKILNIISTFQTYVFVDDTTPEQVAKFATPECTVQIFLKNGTKQVLKFVKRGEQEYLMMVDNDPSVLFAVTPDSVHRFMRTADIFKMKVF
ncbi:MAG: DUF4340 domain-containing protein [Candidatus Cloacimonetes bacterium]|nr:DUF4340 domain-containing protein [Candidatus Cloacimonadota bacterium]